MKMKFSYIILFVMLNLFQHYNSNAQNLVPNGDFEFYTSCPNYYGQITKAFPWYDLSNSTTEYFNTCANDSFAGVPCQVFCYYFQIPQTAINANTCFWFVLEWTSVIASTCQLTNASEASIQISFSYSCGNGITEINPTNLVVCSNIIPSSQPYYLNFDFSEISGSLSSVPPAISVSANIGTICDGESATLTATCSTNPTLYNYTWSAGAVVTGPTTEQANVTPTTSQTYQVTGSDGGQCTSSATVTVTVNPIPTATMIGGGTVCLGDPIPQINVNLEGIGPWNLTYTDGITQTSVIVVTPSWVITNPGNYSIVSVTANNCTGNFSGNASIIVNQLNTVIAASSSSQTVCINTPMNNITFNTTGATGIGTASGLPNGVLAAWASNTITISGTPTAFGTFNYTIPLTGGCGSVNATGTITVPDITFGTPSATVACLNTPISFTMLTNGATGIGTGTGTAMGLPNGVAAVWANNTITISGTPFTSGIFNYSIPLIGNCGSVNATGTITINSQTPTTVGPDLNICQYSTLVLPTNSTNNITGTWTPATVNTSNAGTTVYTFTPDAGQCATTATLSVTVNELPSVSITASSTTPVCAGTGVTLTGTGANTYSWTGGISNGVSFIPIATAPYTVTGTDLNGCSNTTQVTVTVNALPSVSITASQIRVCAGTSVTLTGTGANTYSWTGGISNGVSFIPIATAPYTVTGTDLNGCSNTAQVTVTVNNIPTLTNSSLLPICDETTLYQYTISNFNGTPSDYTITITGPTAGTVYTTTISSIDVWGNFSVQWTSNAVYEGATISVSNVCGNLDYTLEPCCNNGVGNMNFDNKTATWLHANGYAPGGAVWLLNGGPSSFSINGTLIVDHDLQIDGSDVVLGKDASIEISPGKTLTITKSHLHAGDCGQMWYRIHLSGVTPTTYLTIYRSLIEDGKNAVVSDNGGQYMISGSVFNKNYKSIIVGQTALNMNDCKLIDNVFTCRDFASPPSVLNLSSSADILNQYNFLNSYDANTRDFSYQGSKYPQTTLLSPYTGMRSYSGIELNGISNTTPIIIGMQGVNKEHYGNVFDYLDFGIRPFYSNVEIVNNVFTNIYNLVGYPLGNNPIPIQTAGIYAEGMPKIITKPVAMNLLVGGMSTTLKNYFFNCQNGIYSHDYNNDILFNDFKNNVTTSEMPIIPNSNNIAFTKHFGIFLEEGKNRFNTVNSNLMEGQNWGINTIGMAITSASNSSCTLHANIVNVNASFYDPSNISYKSPLGIGVFQRVPISNQSYTAPVQVTNNSIHVFSLTQNHTADGIRVANSGKWKVFHNHIYYKDTHMNNVFPYTSHGIWLESNPGGQVEENYVENGDYTTVLISNNIAFGIENDAGNATIFNNWLVRQSSGITAWGSCLNTQFVCNKLDQCYDGFMFWPPMTDIPDQHYQMTTGNTWNGTAHGYINGQVMNPATFWHDNDPNFSNYVIPGTQLNYTLPPDQTNPCASAGQIFGNNYNVIKRENMLGKIVRGENLYDSTQTENMLSDSIFAYRTLQADTSWLNLGTVDDTTYQHFYYFCANGNIGHFEQVSDALTGNDSTLDLNAVYLANENLVPISTVDTNRQDYNRTYIDKLIYEKDTLNPPGVTYIYDSAEIYRLNKIAHQNPIMGGEAVYQARTALWIDVHDDKTIDPIKRLKQHGVHQEKPYTFKLYPNPNNGNMTLEYKLEEKETGVFGIYSIQGKAIKKYTLNISNTSITIDQSQLAAGAYFWGVKVNEKLVKMDKLIIIK